MRNFPIFRLALIVLCFVGTIMLGACGGTTNSVPATLNGNANSAASGTANAVFRFKIPVSATPQAQSFVARKPFYISPATLSISLQLNEVNGATPSPLPSAQILNVTGSSNNCSTSGGDVTCIVAAQLPVGSDTLTISTYDANNAGGNLLSQQIYTASVTAGNANSFSFGLDANPSNAVFTLTPTDSLTTTTISGGFQILTTNSSQTLTLSLADADGYTIVAPGYPTLSASSSNTNIATASMSGNTLTVAPVAMGTALITVTGAGANSQTSSDGLSSGSTHFTLAVATPVPTGTPAAICTSSPQPMSASGGTIEIPACQGTSGGSIPYTSYSPSGDTNVTATVEVSTVTNFGSWTTYGNLAFIQVTFNSDQGSNISISAATNAGTFDASALGSDIGAYGAAIYVLSSGGGASGTCGTVISDGSGGGITNNMAQLLDSTFNIKSGSYEMEVGAYCI